MSEPAAAPVRFVVYSDYLCPWCQNVAVRLERVAQEFAGQAEFVWKSYLLRTSPRTADLEKFRAYTRGWERIGAEPEAGEFVPWQGDEGPPSHSVPPHRVAKAAARVGPGAFARMHARLMRAYFVESRDITSWDVLEALWRELELPAEGFAVAHQQDILQAVLDDHREAHALGATGVPALRLEGNDAVIVGAHPRELYERWVRKTLERGAAASA